MLDKERNNTLFLFIKNVIFGQESKIKIVSLNFIYTDWLKYSFFNFAKRHNLENIHVIQAGYCSYQIYRFNETESKYIFPKSVVKIS